MNFIKRITNVFLNKTTFSNAYWQELKSEQGGFSVSMPGTPEYKKHIVNTSSGMLDLHEYSLNKPDIAFSASYCDYPAEVVKQTTKQIMLNNVRDGVIAGMHGRLLSELIIEMKGHPGRQLHAEISSGAGIMEGRIYIVENRLYQISVATGKQNAFSTDIGKYLDSFKF